MRSSLFFSAISYNFLTIPGKDFLVGQKYGIYETEDSDKEGRDGNRKGDRCMSRDDRRIKKWRSAGTLGELYLKEMAEQGLLLEDMTHLKYIFREDEPQHLRYRIEELEHAPTDEERAEYAKDGWQEVCHYELDYVFAKECSADEPEVSQEAVLRDLDKK